MNLKKTSCRSMIQVNSNSCNQLSGGESCKYSPIGLNCLQSNQ